LDANAILAAVRDVEACSCAEIVVEVRRRSGSYAHADARFASIAAFLALLVLLFSPWPFPPGWVAVDVLAAWVIGLFASRKSDPIRHLVTTARERAEQVRTTAAAVFHERGVDNTAARTGVLVYVSLLEGRLELLADRGVLQAVPSLEWNQLADSARSRRADADSALAVIRAMQPLLGRCLPVSAGDRDELANDPRFVTE
jgi:putative membrane protein